MTAAAERCGSCSIQLVKICGKLIKAAVGDRRDVFPLRIDEAGREEKHRNAKPLRCLSELRKFFKGTANLPDIKNMIHNNHA